MADNIELEQEYEKIVPWNGAQDTGRDVRMKWERNFQRIKDNFLKVLSAIADTEALDERYIRKDIEDETNYPIGLNAGMTISAKKKAIEDLIREIDRYITNAEDESENDGKMLPSDTTVFTSLATMRAIKEEILRLNDYFLRKDIEDAAHHKITFEDGIDVLTLAKMMELKVEDLATIARAIIPILSSPQFVDGFAGEGYQIWQAIASGDWSFTIDRLTVRKIMTVYELIIQKIRSVGGMICVSAANGKVKTITDLGAETEFEFEDTNTFVEYDLMRCQTWTGNNVKYYWVEVNRVANGKVYVLNTEFEGVIPEVGDECVLMGNSQNKDRQSLILISATEDGQPRIDVLNGVKEKNFNGCLRCRVGNLDGISDDRFPADCQPSGDGLYSDNVFLRGVFVLMNGRDILTQFSVLEGIFKSEIASVRREVGQENNILANSTFCEDTHKWECGNGVRLFTVDKKFLWFNQNFYSDKYNQATIENYQSRWVLRIQNSQVKQLNSDYYQHPTFDKAVDKEFNELPYYKTKAFYLTFWYKCASPGTLTVNFTNATGGDAFEQFTRFSVTKEIAGNNTFELIEFSGQWDGKGDIVVSFSGDIYLYNMALASNSIDDLADKFSTKISQTDRKISLLAEESHSNGEEVSRLRGELTVTAREIRGELTEKTENLGTTLREEYSGAISATARELTVKYDKEVSTLSGSVEKNSSAITQTAKEIRQELSTSVGGITTRLGTIETTANGTKESYSDFVNKTYATYVRENNQSVSTIRDTVNNHSTTIKQNAESIELVANRFNDNGTLKNTSGLVTRDDMNQLTTQYFNDDGSLKNTSGLATRENFAILFAAEIDSNGLVKKAEISTFITEDDAGNLISNATIQADKISFTGKTIINGNFVVDANGNVTMKNTTVTGTINATAGKIGGMKVSGNGLTNEGFNNDAYIILRNDTTKTFAGIGGAMLPATSGGVQAVARFENARPISNTDNIAMYCYANGATGTGKNYAIWVAKGQCWMPGVLFAGTVQWPSTDSAIQITAKYNFEFLSRVSASGSSVYGYIQIDHNLGHTNYLVIATPAGQNTLFVGISNKTSTSFRIYMYGRDGSYQWNNPVSFAVIGLNYK